MMLVGKSLAKRYIRTFVAALLSWAVSNRWSRVLLNNWYISLRDNKKLRFYERYAKIFYSKKYRVESGMWSIPLIGGVLRLPLDQDNIGLDWDHSVSVLGHDQEIKQTYINIISSENRPALFLDVGANFGMHSALMAIAGVETISFEPNPYCKEYFYRMSAYNEFKVRWEAVALGDREGEVVLSFPEGETWLGSVVPEVQDRLSSVTTLISRMVRLTKLDHYISQMPPGNILMKMDVEGAELPVLKGAEKLLRERRPNIIFESNELAQRVGLYKNLSDAGYDILCLPWSPGQSKPHLTEEEFVENTEPNFIALPREVRAVVFAGNKHPDHIGSVNRG